MTTLKPGDKSPQFEGIDQDGNTIQSSDFQGKPLIIFFYPKDNTPGCTNQVCNLRDNYQILIDAGYQIIGISADSTKSHKKFIEKHSLPFPLIADTDKTIIEAFGIWGEKKFMGRKYMGIHRTTFVLDGDHNIVHVIEKVKTKDHANQILALV